MKRTMNEFQRTYMVAKACVQEIESRQEEIVQFGKKSLTLPFGLIRLRSEPSKIQKSAANGSTR